MSVAYDDDPELFETGFARGELEGAIKQRVEDGFGYFMVSIFHDGDDETCYGRDVVVKARDAEHAKAIPLAAGEEVEDVHLDTAEMYAWRSKHPVSAEGHASHHDLIGD